MHATLTIKGFDINLALCLSEILVFRVLYLVDVNVKFVCCVRRVMSRAHFLDVMLCFVAYCVVADESVGRQVPVAFLERVKDDFVAKYGGGKAATAAPNSLNKEFGY